MTTVKVKDRLSELLDRIIVSGSYDSAAQAREVQSLWWQSIRRDVGQSGNSGQKEKTIASE
jgi:hypothetical protein